MHGPEKYFFHADYFRQVLQFICCMISRRGKKVVIYGEYLFLENFVTGVVLLCLTAKLADGRISRLRLAAAGTVCGAGGFTIFLGAGGLAAVLVRVIIALAAVAVCFGTRGIVKKTIVFVSLTFLSGGAAMAFLLWQEIAAVSGNGALYMPPLTYGKIFGWGSLAFWITWGFIKIVRERRNAVITRGDVFILINGRQYVFEALADSGNSLKEPLTGRPVNLMGKTAAMKLEGGIPPERFVTVPYHAVGTEKGMLNGFRTDEIQFGGRVYKKSVIAFYEEDFEDFEVLLSREVLNEEIT